MAASPFLFVHPRWYTIGIRVRCTYCTAAERPVAHLQKHSSGNFRIKFWWAGNQYLRSLETSRQATAERMKDEIEDTIQRLKTGRLTMPPEVDDPATFIVSGGRITSKAKPGEKPTTVGEAVTAYFSSIPEGSKATSSLNTERIHLATSSGFSNRPRRSCRSESPTYRIT